MADVFLNSANFAKNTFSTLAPPSSYALKYLDLHLKEKLIRQTSFLQKNTSQKPASFRVNGDHILSTYCKFGPIWLQYSFCMICTNLVNPKRPGLFWGVLFGEMKFVLSNFLSNENLSISYKSWDVQLTFDTLINAFRFKA